MSDFMTALREGWAARTEEARRDSRSTPELITLALCTDEEAPEYWETVSTLHYRATREVFEAAETLSRSGCSRERTLAADILGQLGIPDRLSPEDCLSVLTGMSLHEPDSGVLASVCTALGHLHHPGAVGALLRWKGHAAVAVRLSVAIALGGREEPEAIDGLIDLSADPDEVVRDWATFGLGSQTDLDTPRIREALLARLDDPDAVTRGEALVGLARRKDERVIPPLLKELRPERLGEVEREWEVVLEAAEELADPRLLPSLLPMRGHPNGERIEEIIRRCQGEADA